MRRANSADVSPSRPLFSLLFLSYLSTPHQARSNQCALMSCPIHDRCACCSTSLQYAASITTTTGSSQFAPQSGNIVFGYEWGAPLVTASGGPWHTVDPVTFRPASTLYSGQDLSQPDRYRARNSYETMPLHHTYHRETRAHPHEQKQALSSREQVRIVIVNLSSQAHTGSIRDASPHTRHTSKGSVGWQSPTPFRGQRYQRSICIVVARPVSQATRNSRKPCRHLIPARASYLMSRLPLIQIIILLAMAFHNLLSCLLIAS